jgi:hypothetical protein
MDYVVAPYTVIVDSREQHPYSFTGYKADARQGRKPLIVPVEIAGLPTGDYSIKGLEHAVACERKSLQDAYQTFCHGHDRFERELARLNALPGWAGIVVESSWGSAIRNPPPHTKYSPKSFYRQVRAWQIRFRGVHWEFCETRSWAERTTLRWLERYYLDEMKRQKVAG